MEEVEVIVVFVFEQLDLIFLCVSAIHARRTICKDYVVICLSILYKIFFGIITCKQKHLFCMLCATLWLFCMQWRHQKFFLWEGIGGQDAITRGQKSKNLQKMVDFGHLFLLTGGRGTEPPMGGMPPCPPPLMLPLFVCYVLHFDSPPLQKSGCTSKIHWCDCLQHKTPILVVLLFHFSWLGSHLMKSPVWNVVCSKPRHALYMNQT